MLQTRWLISAILSYIIFPKHVKLLQYKAAHRHKNISLKTNKTILHDSDDMLIDVFDIIGHKFSGLITVLL